MRKNIVMALVLVAFLGCSEKKSTPVHKKHIDLANNKSTTEKKMVEEFIPDHIRKSKIEVVKRN